MSAVHPTLSENTIDRVRAGWAAKIDVSLNALSDEGRVLLPREGSSNVIALQLQQSIVVICPPSLEPFLSPLSGADLLDMITLMQLLKSYSPVPFGTATISYAQRNTLVDPSGGVMTRPAGSEEVVEIMSRCTHDEQDESGLERMPFRFVAQSSNRKATALSGYEVWNSDIAQLGVLTAPQMRGQGFGSAVAAAAATAALDANLIPQWRSRVDNEPSQQLGRQLGFAQLGLQLALAVTLS